MFLECIKDLIRIDKDWVPKAKDTSLYVRPTYIGTEVRYRAKQKWERGGQCPALDYGQIYMCSSTPVFSSLHSYPPIHPLISYYSPILFSFSPHFLFPILSLTSIVHFSCCVPFPIPFTSSPFPIIPTFSISALHRCSCL